MERFVEGPLMVVMLPLETLRSDQWQHRWRKVEIACCYGVVVVDD
jgi:hypothetical protein